MDVLRMYIQTRVFNINKEDMVFMSWLFSYGDKYEFKGVGEHYLCIPECILLAAYMDGALKLL